MRIERAKNLQEMMQCVPIENTMRKKEKELMPLKDFLLFLALHAENPNLAMWFVYDEKKEIIGYTVAMLISMPGIQNIWIIRAWYDHHFKELPKIFMKKTLRKWARENNIKKFSITINRGIKAYQRTWGFKVVSVNMERRIY